MSILLALLFFSQLFNSVYSFHEDERRIKANTRAVKLELKSINSCIGFHTLGDVVESGDVAIYTNCDFAPEFEITDDYQLKADGFCLHAVSEFELQAQECQNKKDAQVFYPVAVSGQEDTWRFFSKDAEKFLDIRVQDNLSYEQAPRSYLFMPQYYMAFNDDNKESEDQMFIGIDYEKLYS